MRVALTITCLIAAAPAAAQVDSNARGSTTATVSPGQTIRDVEGAVVGRVESVTAGPDGRPRQVLVRTGGVARVGSSLKALPAASLRPEGNDTITVLTRAEVNALPDAPR